MKAISEHIANQKSRYDSNWWPTNKAISTSTYRRHSRSFYSRISNVLSDYISLSSQDHGVSSEYSGQKFLLFPGMPMNIYYMFALLGSVVSLVSSSPLSPRQCFIDCVYCWSQDSVQNATTTGCSYLANNNSPYKYPNMLHYTSDRTLAVGLPDSGPCYQYPAFPNGNVYQGGDPGNFFAVFKKDCTYEGLVTNLPFSDPSIQGLEKLVPRPGAGYAACF